METYKNNDEIKIMMRREKNLKDILIYIRKKYLKFYIFPKNVMFEIVKCKQKKKEKV